MADVTIYTRPTCPFCIRAKKLLTQKGQEFTEITVDSDAVRDEMIKKAGGGYTVPQIFINDEPIGGCDELHALDDAGKLDGMLAAPGKKGGKRPPPPPL